jgi:hypothetical protein
MPYWSKKLRLCLYRTNGEDRPNGRINPFDPFFIVQETLPVPSPKPMNRMVQYMMLAALLLAHRRRHASKGVLH